MYLLLGYSSGRCSLGQLLSRHIWDQALALWSCDWVRAARFTLSQHCWSKTNVAHEKTAHVAESKSKHVLVKKNNTFFKIIFLPCKTKYWLTRSFLWCYTEFLWTFNSFLTVGHLIDKAWVSRGQTLLISKLQMWNTDHTLFAIWVGGDVACFGRK